MIRMLMLALALPVSASSWAAPRRDAVLLREFVYQQAPYPQSHASTIVQTRNGALAAAWFGGTHERSPDVEIWFARRDAKGWETPRSVANGIQPDGTRLPTWNPVLFQDPAGPLHLYYKLGPSPQSWWGMVVTSPDGGRSWSKPQRLPEGMLGPIKNKPVVLRSGAWLAPSSTENGSTWEWKLHFERSEDSGRSWTQTAPVPVDPEARFDAIQPSILFLPGGKLEAIARSRQGVLVAAQSADEGKSWGKLFAVDLPNPNSGTDAVTLKDGRQLIVYNHAAQQPDTPGKGRRYPLNIAISRDGVHWRPALTLETEPLPEGYAYPAVIQSADGLVHITYTWNRQRIRHVVVDPARLAG
ncbi:putative neuraminidase [Sphingomonas kyeonggiensis]|uniref:sialidase family protein n=1 Tax=Sphingomonas kyeonggiensis TaxID=1268553 RepID=UPI002783AB77|nr:sialidase family protein [Sphingomonas kyeonggiensis]MDQ0248655.1 putative neuraminidase [Sphingomonas kyeonggiensis]